MRNRFHRVNLGQFVFLKCNKFLVWVIFLFCAIPFFFSKNKSSQGCLCEKWCENFPLLQIVSCATLILCKYVVCFFCEHVVRLLVLLICKPTRVHMARIFCLTKSSISFLSQNTDTFLCKKSLLILPTVCNF